MKNEKFAYSPLLVFLFLFLFTTSIFAESKYVLPYPPVMPGGFSYKIRLVYENISKYWHFGSFGQFSYNLKMTDKYLIEAKTLFEYKQYLLGYKALQKSNQYFTSIFPNLSNAEKNGKNILQKRTVFIEAVQKHIEVLEQIKKNIPNTFIWQPEKSIPTTLNLERALNDSIKLRSKGI